MCTIIIIARLEMAVRYKEDTVTAQPSITAWGFIGFKIYSIAHYSKSLIPPKRKVRILII